MRIQSTSFRLGEELTSEQLDFFRKNGFIHFSNFISHTTRDTFISEIDRIASSWLENGVEKVNGIPLKFGQDEQGRKMVQRLAFTSQYSKILAEFLKDPRFTTLLGLLAPFEGRIGEQEKDGLVVNQYINSENSKFTQMGWHTDSPRDIFLQGRIRPMLNVGIHLDDCLYKNGGLRVIPGTHTQGMVKMLFKKKYFVDHTSDPEEVGFDIKAGDLTIHDGRLWHRVQRSPLVGRESLRRVMYVPIITGKYKPKDENSKTPFYHRFAGKVQD